MVTDDALCAVLPRIAGMLVQRAVRQYCNAALSAALAWPYAG